MAKTALRGNPSGTMAARESTPPTISDVWLDDGQTWVLEIADGAAGSAVLHELETSLYRAVERGARVAVIDVSDVAFVDAALVRCLRSAAMDLRDGGVQIGLVLHTPSLENRSATKEGEA